MKNLEKISLTTPALCLILILTSCQKDPLEGYVAFEKSEIQTLDDSDKKVYVIKILDEKIQLKEDLTQIKSDALDFNPFNEYLSRDFFKNSTTSRYFLDEVPGHIFKKENGQLIKISIKRFVNNNGYPKTKVVDKTYYNDRITDRNQLNATAKILNVSISEKQIAEMLIKDESTTYLPDSLIDISRIKTLINKIDESDLGKYYFVQGATIASVTHRVFSKQKFTAKVDLAYLTASQETYSSIDNMKTRMDVCLELTSLKEYKVIIED